MKRATVQLGDFLTLKRGYDLPEHARLPGEIPVISSSGITGTHKEAKVDGLGVVTGRYGTLGEVFYIDEPFWPLNTALYVKDFKGNHRRFVSYFLKWILNGTQSDKAAVPGVNRNDLNARKVKIPEDLGEQASIAAVRSTYDGLIENNRRGFSCWKRRPDCSTRNGSSTSAFPATSTPESSMACRRGGRKKDRRSLRNDRKRHSLNQSFRVLEWRYYMGHPIGYYK